jgi:trk system potassium uptake protein TrkA
MRIMIIGGGNVGYYLTKSLSARKDHIMIIEEDRARCEQMAADLGSEHIGVTCGDGTDISCLRDAGIFDTDVLVAVTGHDQNNLVACQLAKEHFGVKQTIARVKNPKNIRVFEKLGVDSVISSTERIAGIIDQELDWADVNRLLKDRSCDVRLREITVTYGSKLEHKHLKELGFPKGVIMIAVLRGDKAIIPDGETYLETGDMAVVWGSETDIAEVQK